jgi:hypothetical protein
LAMGVSWGSSVIKGAIADTRILFNFIDLA